MWIVVETIENGKTFSTAVPKSWIADNCLLWPTQDCEIDEARKNNKSPQTNWTRLPCKELSQITGTVKIVEFCANLWSVYISTLICRFFFVSESFNEALDLEKIYGNDETDDENRIRTEPNGNANEHRQRSSSEESQPGEKDTLLPTVRNNSVGNIIEKGVTVNGTWHLVFLVFLLLIFIILYSSSIYIEV